MKQVAHHLREVITETLQLLQKVHEDEASLKPRPDKWSKKEILGHLIDSACNNHQKFIRTMSNPHVDFVGYEQNFWVAAQQYNTAKWQELTKLWAVYNYHLAFIIESVNEELLSHTISIEGSGTYRLDFIMTDYVEHLKHHLKQILPESHLTSHFQNIYNT